MVVPLWECIIIFVTGIYTYRLGMAKLGQQNSIRTMLQAITNNYTTGIQTISINNMECDFD